MSGCSRLWPRQGEAPEAFDLVERPANDGSTAGTVWLIHSVGHLCQQPETVVLVHAGVPSLLRAREGVRLDVRRPSRNPYPRAET